MTQSGRVTWAWEEGRRERLGKKAPMRRGRKGLGIFSLFYNSKNIIWLNLKIWTLSRWGTSCPTWTQRTATRCFLRKYKITNNENPEIGWIMKIPKGADSHLPWSPLPFSPHKAPDYRPLLQMTFREDLYSDLTRQIYLKKILSAPFFFFHFFLSVTCPLNERMDSHICTKMI